MQGGYFYVILMMKFDIFAKILLKAVDIIIEKTVEK